MLTIKRLQENTEEVIARLEAKGFPAREYVEATIADDAKRRALQAKIDASQATLNASSRSIGLLLKEGKRQEAEDLKASLTDRKQEVKQLSEEQNQLAESITNRLLLIPNIPHSSVPNGRTAEDNIVVRSEGEVPELPSERLSHWDIASKLGIIDFELGVKITGSGFPLFIGAGALLERSLINFFIEENTRAGYTEMMPPILVNQASAYGTGQLPDKDSQMYHVGLDDLYLVPTAEVPLTNVLRDTILEEQQLPFRMTAYTPCFRREAGSYGKDVRGLNRLHQFDKVEIVCVDTPERSYDRLEEMVQHVEGLLQKLELPYRVLKLCTGDMSFTSALTYDLEVFSAGQERWLEVSSVSNFEDYQANRMHLRYRTEHGRRNILPHTLNGSSLALPRVVAALLENNQTVNGVRIPRVLQDRMGLEELRWA